MRCVLWGYPDTFENLRIKEAGNLRTVKLQTAMQR